MIIKEIEFPWRQKTHIYGTGQFSASTDAFTRANNERLSHFARISHCLLCANVNLTVTFPNA